MSTLWQDLRYGVRALGKNRGMTLAALLTLALGIGANTAIFSLLDQVLLRKLPVERPEELVILSAPGPSWGHIWSDGHQSESFSFPIYKYLREKNEVLAGLLARHPVALSFATEKETERANGELVSGNYFQVLGVKPALGRLFTQEDDQLASAHPVVVLSHGFWLRRFAGQASILNRQVIVNGHSMTVVGVAQAGFQGIQVGASPDAFIPVMMKAQITPNWDGMTDENDYWLHVIGRLKPGIPREKAVAALNVLYRPFLEEQLVRAKSNRPEDYRRKFLNKNLELVPAAGGRTVFQDETKTPLLVLMGLVVAVLLIACTNIVNLMLARGMARAREYAVRLAIGASHVQLMRQVLVESLILAIGGGIAALLVASWTVSGLLAAMPATGVAGLSASLDGRVLLVNFAIAIVAGLLFGLVPALRTTRADVSLTLRDQGNTISAGRSVARLRKAMLAGQLALTLLLLIGAGLFVRSLYNLRHVDLGVRPENVLTFSVSPDLNGYSPARSLAFQEQLIESLKGMPGVGAVSTATVAAFTDSGNASNFTFEGYEAKEGDSTHLYKNFLGPRYFSTMGTPLLAGREFTEQDTVAALKVVILSESAARKFFPNRSPLGLRIAQGGGNVKLDTEIVGVVQDSRHMNVRDVPELFVYFPIAQKPGLGEMTFYVRISQLPETFTTSVRSAVRALDPNLPIYQLKTLERQIDESLFGERAMMVLTISFGSLAALLAAIGLYGLLAYVVGQRTREIGIRMAMGARKASIVRLVLRDVARMAAVGLMIGLPAAYGLGRVAESLLYGVKAANAGSYLLGVGLMLTVALLAGYLPARRATRVDPMTALRYE